MGVPVIMDDAVLAAEADMLAPLAAAASFLAGTAVDVVYEVPTMAAGVPDLVLVDRDHEALRHRGGAGPVTEPVGVAVLVALTEAADVGLSSLSADAIARQVGMTAAYVRRRVLPSLLERGHVNLNSDSTWSPAYPYRSLARRLVTVEAKLRDWKRGLGQAVRHAPSADAAWLAISEAGATPASRHRETLDVYGVGLAVVAHCGDVQTIHAPSARQPRRVAREVLAERSVALLAAGQCSGPVEHVFGRMHIATRGPDPRLASASAGHRQ